jgi:4-carboxymuconolactone decarboxylase
VIIAGFYAAVGRIVNSFDIELEPGYESLTPRDESA